MPVTSENGASGTLEEAVFARPADCYVAAMGRSGSTLVCNLLTRPPTRWLMNEPWFARGGKGTWQLEKLRRFGVEISDQAWRPQTVAGRKETDAERLRRIFGPIIEGLERWGAKEVRPEHHSDTIALLRPKKIVVLVRDVRDVAASLLEKHARQGNAAYDRAWSQSYVVAAAKAMVTASRCHAGAGTRVVRYEDFVVDPAYRQALARWLDWPFDEDLANALEGHERPWELARHGHRVTARSVGRHSRERPRAAVDFVAEMAEACSEYQHLFGYVNP